MSLLPVADALKRVTAPLSPLSTEFVSLGNALGRVLAEDVFSRRTHPPSDVSAMDGYALRADDVSSLPASLKLIGESAAGGAAPPWVAAGEAVRIFTGAMVPDGADAIALQEDVTLDDNVITVHDLEPDRHIRPKGLDLQDGRICLSKGTKIGAAGVGLLAAANVVSIPVVRRPQIALLSTGSELVLPGQTPGEGQIISSNAVMLSALIRSAGAIPIDLGPVPDDASALEAAADGLKQADIAVTIGGASVGDHDLVQKVLGPKGLEVDFWKIAMRPGKPLISGTFSGVPFLGLPGNPVSAFVCATLFLKAMVRAQLGAGDDATDLDLVPAYAGENLPKNGARMTFMRARRSMENGVLTVAPLTLQDSSVLSALAAADCLIVRPPRADVLAKGSAVSILCL